MLFQESKFGLDPLFFSFIYLFFMWNMPPPKLGFEIGHKRSRLSRVIVVPLLVTFKEKTWNSHWRKSRRQRAAFPSPLESWGEMTHPEQHRRENEEGNKKGKRGRMRERERKGRVMDIACPLLCVRSSWLALADVLIWEGEARHAPMPGRASTTLSPLFFVVSFRSREKVLYQEGPGLQRWRGLSRSSLKCLVEWRLRSFHSLPEID